MTPEKLTDLFNAYAILAMAGVGVVWKYAPFMRKWANDLIPWANAILGILTQLLAVPAAHAALSPGVQHATLGVTDVVFNSFVHSVIARQLYEGFGRSLLEKLIGFKKPL